MIIHKSLLQFHNRSITIAADLYAPPPKAAIPFPLAVSERRIFHTSAKARSVADVTSQLIKNLPSDRLRMAVIGKNIGVGTGGLHPF